MKNKNLIRKIFFCLGIVLLVIPLVFLAVTFIQSSRIKVNCGETAEFLESILPETVPGIKEEQSDNEMPSVSFGGQDYAALICVPRFNVKLPVRASWGGRYAKKVPCRYSGSPYEGTLIIGGTDAGGQFDFLSKTDIGDIVTITDMRGQEFTYVVTAVKHADNARTGTLTDNSCDLTLFAKDRHTGKWLLVRCKMKY